jgi:hypothetical protein
MPNYKTYVVGNNDKIFRKDDNQGSWIDVSPNSINAALSLSDVMTDPSDPNKVIAIGQKQRINNSTSGQGIIVSNDAGVTWTTPGGDWLPSSGAYVLDFKEIWFVDSNVIWVVGSKGLVVKSTDGGLTFNRTNQIPITNLITVNIGNTTTQQDGNFTHAIHAISSDVAIVSCTDGIGGYECYIFKTTDGGVTWSLLNGGNSLSLSPNPYNYGGLFQSSEGIWMSNDEQVIIVITEPLTYKSTDGGSTFNIIEPDGLTTKNRNFHLTWYPSYTPVNYKITGTHEPDACIIKETTDVGLTWNCSQSFEGKSSRAAHFYSLLEGYYIIDNGIYHSSDNGLTSDVGPDTFTDAQVLFAVWTGKEDSTFCYTAINCKDDTEIINIQFDTQVDTSLIYTFNEYPDKCWSLITNENCAGTFVNVTLNTNYITCNDCLGYCYNLISCNGECEDLINVQADVDFNVTPGELVITDYNSECVYKIYPLYEYYFLMKKTNQFSSLSGPLQNGAIYKFTITSIEINNVEQLQAPINPYYMDLNSYNPLYCVNNNCSSALINTFENSWSNLVDYLNFNFQQLNLPLQAINTGSSPCENIRYSNFIIQASSDFKIVITESQTNSNSIITYTYEVNSGNVITTIDINGNSINTFDGCGGKLKCIENEFIYLIDQYSGTCPDSKKECKSQNRIINPNFKIKGCE